MVHVQVELKIQIDQPLLNGAENEISKTPEIGNKCYHVASQIAESDNENYSREQEDCENEEELIDNDGLSDPEEREGDHEEAHEDEGDDSMKMMEMSTLY
ncbi:hypothetical protein M758_UG208800 [Ceratodon purpureus]|nr:hypothetical protein M758_UG208800 [Ceratodon purpureus]